MQCVSSDVVFIWRKSLWCNFSVRLIGDNLLLPLQKQNMVVYLSSLNSTSFKTQRQRFLVHLYLLGKISSSIFMGKEWPIRLFIFFSILHVINVWVYWLFVMLQALKTISPWSGLNPKQLSNKYSNCVGKFWACILQVKCYLEICLLSLLSVFHEALNMDEISQLPPDKFCQILNMIT